MERAAWTPRQLAERWECSERHVRNLINRGELQFFPPWRKVGPYPPLGGRSFRARRGTESRSLADRRKRRACGAYAADQVSTESHWSALMGYWLDRTLHKLRVTISPSRVHRGQRRCVG
jgi:hypothetical protein